MDGFWKKTLASLALGTGLFSVTGCVYYRQIVDPCWPERYNSVARHSVRDTFNAQAFNGHVLDQTVWTYMFEADPKTGEPTERLHPSGKAHLDYLARRRPVPDAHVFLQTSGDGKLDEKRVAAIQTYLGKVMSNRNQAIAFNVVVHDPAEVGISANPIAGNQRPPAPLYQGSVPLLFQNFKGKMQEATGTLGTGGAGTGGGTTGGS